MNLKVDDMILRELDRHFIRAEEIPEILNKLFNFDKKMEFLNYLLENRNVYLFPLELKRKVESIIK